MNVGFYLRIRPKPKQRPRFSNGHTYTPRETQDYENQVRFMVKSQMDQNGWEPFQDHASMEVWFTFGRKEFKKYHNSRPDIDNLLKAVQDALNGVLYRDDSIITEISARKYYGYESAIMIKAEGE